MVLRNTSALLAVIVIMVTGEVVSAVNSNSASEIRLALVTQIDSSTSRPLEVQPPPALRARVIERRIVSGPPSRERDPQLSAYHLLVVGSAKNGQEIIRTIIPDPRLVRAESFSLSGEIESSKMIYQEHVEFSVFFPADQPISSIKLYHPKWTGKKFTLELIGEVSLP